jgi:restriction endonuclease S subunit
VINWTELTLGETCELYQPKTISTKDMVADGEYPVFGANGIIGQYDKFNHEESQLLVTCRGATCGSVNISLPKSWITGNAMVVRPKQNNLSLGFLEYFFRGACDFSKVITGSAQPQITRQTFAPVKIKIPSLPEQRRIVAVLDEAFEGLAIATANIEKILKNARELFEEFLNSVLTQRNEDWIDGTLESIAGRVFTGPFGSLLHKSDYILGGTPLINPAHIIDGRIVPESHKTIDDVAVKRLSSYILKSGDIVIGRRGEIGRCAVITEAEAGWLCGTGSFFIRVNNNNSPDFLVHLLRSRHYRAKLEALSAGATMLNLSNSALSDLEICVPSLKGQMAALEQLDLLRNVIEKVEAVYVRKLAAIAELKQSLLQKAFAGELTKDFQPSVVASPATSKLSSLSTADLHAGVLAMAYDRHHRRDKHKTFGHVKAQKFLHLVESVGRIDLGRAPIKDAAGPNDFQHMLRAENWAKQSEFFEFAQRLSGNGYEFKKLVRFDDQLKQANASLEPFRADLNKVIDLIIDMNSEEAELFATVYAAWNNLIIDKASITDQAIVREARENWHSDKLKIPEQRFHNALNSIRTRNLEPDGTAKYVGGQQKLI